MKTFPSGSFIYRERKVRGCGLVSRLKKETASDRGRTTPTRKEECLSRLSGMRGLLRLVHWSNKWHWNVPLKLKKKNLSYIPILFSLSLVSRTFFKMMRYLLCEHVIPSVHKINLLLASCSQECQGISPGDKKHKQRFSLAQSRERKAKKQWVLNRVLK